VWWEIEWSFNGKFCQEYLYLKLSKSGNCFSRYNRNVGDVFFETQCIRLASSHVMAGEITWCIIIS